MTAVSVAITTFNRAEDRRRTIPKVTSQALIVFELLVCDDGGLEETKRLCENFRDRRILHAVNRTRLGIAMNTYAGILRARSDAMPSWTAMIGGQVIFWPSAQHLFSKTPK